MIKRGIWGILLILFGGVLYWGGYYFFTPDSHAIPNVNRPPEITEKNTDPPKKLKTVDEAAQEVFFIWEKGFLLKNVHTSTEFIEEFNLELKSRFEETFNIFKECGAPLEMAIRSAFPLQLLARDVLPKYLLYTEKIHRLLLLQWKSLESIHLFLIQSLESANQKGFIVAPEKLSMVTVIQNFQNSLYLKEAVYGRLYDYLYFLDQVVDDWKFDGKRIWIDPSEIQEDFDTLVIDLYYALQQAQEAELLPPEIQLGVRFDDTNYWKDKQVSIQKIQAGSVLQPYDYLEVFRNYCWNLKNFTLPPTLPRNDYVSFAIALYQQLLKKLEEPLAKKISQTWDPLLFEPTLYRKKAKSMFLAQKQLVLALWFYYCKYQASYMMLRFGALGLIQKNITYSELLRYNQWQQKEQKKIYTYYLRQKELIKLVAQLYEYIAQYGQIREDELFFENTLIRERFENALQSFEKIRQERQE